jgi:hypothetical protein
MEMSYEKKEYCMWLCGREKNNVTIVAKDALNFDVRVSADAWLEFQISV